MVGPGDVVQEDRVKPGDLVIAKAAKVKRRNPPSAIMLYDWKTTNYYPWKNGNLGMIIALDRKTEGVIIMADGHVGWVSQVIIEVVDD
jgi:hypothetical protein